MISYLEDPIINVIINGIKKPIELLYSNECYSAALIVIFSSIDTMSNLNRPKNKDYGTRNDFKEWLEEYFHLEGDTQISTSEWYAARCSILHSMAAVGQRHKEENLRSIGWFLRNRQNSIIYDKSKPNLIMVNLISFKDAFISAMDGFLIDVFKEENEKYALVNERLKELYHTYHEFN